MAVRNFLSNRSVDILARDREVIWQHVSAAVVFGKPIQFEERVLGPTLKAWFQVTDLNRVAERLAALDKPTLQLSAAEVLKIPVLLGLSRRHLYSATSSLPASGDNSVEPVDGSPTPRRFQLNYLKEIPFRDYERRLNECGGARSLAAQRVRMIFEAIRQGLQPLATLERKSDSRVAGAVRYRLNHQCELLLIENEHNLFPAFVGPDQEVDVWLEAHRGLTITVDVTTGRISVTTVSTNPQTAASLQPPALSSDSLPFLARIKGLDLEGFGIPKLAREIIGDLDESSTPEEIADAVELIGSEDHRTLIFDLVNLVRAGDLNAAETRLRLRDGEAIPVADAGAFGGQAASSPVNSDQVLVVNDLSKEELDRLLDPAHFEDWMLFLHPDQRQLAEASLDRPLVLTGVSGSGKTCILVHRARHLVRKYPGQRIGILTLSQPLAGLLKNLVNSLCTEEERQNIHVLPFYQHFRDCLKHLGLVRFCDQLTEILPAGAAMHGTIARLLERWPASMVWECDPINRAHVDDEWNEFYQQNNPDVCEWLREVTKPLEDARVDASRYLEEEFTLVRSSFPIPSRTRSYLEMERVGRTFPFRESLRRHILQLVTFWEDWLLAGGMIDALGLTLALLPMHQEMQQIPEELRFRCLLVDEFQDLSSLDLQVLRRVVPIKEPDSLFVAGDTVQKVLVKRLSLGGGVGLDRGPAIHKSIRKNYRNSRQILRAAARLANHYGQIARSQGEEMEILDPELAQRETNPPIVLKTDRQIEKAWEIVLECVGAQVLERWSVCIVTAAPEKVTIKDILALAPSGLNARPLSGDGILHKDEVIVSAISDLKGFEFRVVLIIGCDEGLLPAPGVPSDEVWRDALRLYVAMTRGRDQVYLLHASEPSEFVTVMGDTLVSREEPVLRGYEWNSDSTPPLTRPIVSPIEAGSTSQMPVRTLSVIPAFNRLDPDANCEDRFSLVELEALKKYYAQKVHRDNLTFHEWCRPRSLATINLTGLFGVRRVSPTALQALAEKLKDMGVLGAVYERPASLRTRAQCCAHGCCAKAIPGEDYCYDHKTE
jgi:superfamily I DNA/RNA helicase